MRQSVRKCGAPTMLFVAAILLLSGCVGASTDPAASGEQTYSPAIDQDNLGATSGGGLTVPVVQSFQPAEPALVGADFVAAALAGGAPGDFVVRVYENWSAAAGVSDLVVETDVFAVPANATGQARWAPVTVTVDQTYYLQIDYFDKDALGAGSYNIRSSSTTDEYPRGDVVSGGGNLSNTADILFATYYALYD